jgi:hypothetical protein
MMVYMELSVFSCLEMFKQTLGSNLGIGKSKLGFGGENGSFPETTVITRYRTRNCELDASNRGSLEPTRNGE